MKNIDRIRQMTADELAEFLCGDCLLYCIYNANECIDDDGDCKQGIKQWLEQEVRNKWMRRNEIN